MNSLFKFRSNTQNIRHFQEIFTEKGKPLNDTETVTYRAPFLWAISVNGNYAKNTGKT